MRVLSRTTFKTETSSLLNCFLRSNLSAVLEQVFSRAAFKASFLMFFFALLLLEESSFLFNFFLNTLFLVFPYFFGLDVGVNQILLRLYDCLPQQCQLRIQSLLFSFVCFGILFLKFLFNFENLGLGIFQCQVQMFSHLLLNIII